MAKQYVKTTYTGKGFITHDEQEKNKLTFKIFTDLVTLDCLDANPTNASLSVNNWITKVNGQVLAEKDAISYAEPIWKAGIAARIASLSAEIVDLKSLKFDINNL